MGRPPLWGAPSEPCVENHDYFKTVCIQTWRRFPVCDGAEPAMLKNVATCTSRVALGIGGGDAGGRAHRAVEVEVDEVLFNVLKGGAGGRHGGEGIGP